MNATEYAIATTEREIDQAYIDFRRMLTLGRSHDAVKQAIGLAKHDAEQLWSFLRTYVSTDINYRETSALLAVNALFDTWVRDKSTVSIAHAVMTLISAPKGDSAARFIQ